MSHFELIEATGSTPESLARVEAPEREPFRIGAVQQAWHEDPVTHQDLLAEGIRLAAGAGARIVCLQELTLSPYFAITEDAIGEAEGWAEEIGDGATSEFARRMAIETGAFIHAPLYEKADDGGLGFNTAVCFGPGGSLVASTRKLHIPVTAGYYEDRYFRQGDTGYPVVEGEGAKFGFPTCWDQWFPELARAYSLAGAEVIVYPTAIGSEPDHPGFNTEPLWERVIVGNGIANGTFMVTINRIGLEGPLTFYGSSFVSDPYGRILVQAPRDRPAVIVTDLDLDQRKDWLELFPFLQTRRPDTYGPLTS